MSKSPELVMREKINLFLTGLLLRSNDLSDSNKSFVLSYDAEMAISNFLEELNKISNNEIVEETNEEQTISM
jgi:hypothetical protein